MAAPKQVIKSTTQQHLDVEEIAENLILLKDGSAAMIITTTAVNFGLLSESEQDATIYAYAALLNSLTFPIQIFIRSNRKDITGYERLLEEQELRSAKPENKERIRKYREFIEETVRQRNVLDKKFYIVIPFFVLELGVTKSATAIAKGGHTGLPFPKEYIIGRAKMTLEPKRDHVEHQLARLGLRARQLTTKELIQLLFEIYNPDSSQGQTLVSPQEYETPIVQPAVAFQEVPQINTQQQPPLPQESQPKTQPPPPNPISTSTPANQPTPLPTPQPETSSIINETPAISQPTSGESHIVSQDPAQQPKATDNIQATIDSALKEQ